MLHLNLYSLTYFKYLNPPSPANQSVVVVVVNIGRLVHVHVYRDHISCKPDASLLNEPVLVKLYAVVVNKVCMKQDNSGPNNFKRDN